MGVPGWRAWRGGRRFLGGGRWGWLWPASTFRGRRRAVRRWGRPLLVLL